MQIKSRLNKLRQVLRKNNISGILITNPINCSYLSGFTGTDSILLIGLNKAYFITDFRYTEQAKKEVTGFTIVERGLSESLFESAAKLVGSHKWLQIGFESDHLSYSSHKRLKKSLGKTNLVSTEKLVETIREIKDDSEIKLIKKAAEIADIAFERTIPMIKVSKTEIEIAAWFESESKKLGADKVAFEVIVASGTRGSLPHGIASRKKFKPGELITIDFGIVYQGYCSDCTRTLVLGQPNEKQMIIYSLVLQAQLTALQAVKPGVVCKEIDSIARSILEKTGYGNYFGHGLGHGVGREVHELPRVSKLGQTKLVPGMVITIEPGIYLPNWGGVRIEDLVLVTDKGYKILSSFPKELISLPI
ncbi:MAG: M24 family metallopeptidase [bacterium]